MVTAFNPGYSATEAGRLQVQDQPQQLKREVVWNPKEKEGCTYSSMVSVCPLHIRPQLGLILNLKQEENKYSFAASAF